jgi:predicted anti-sigma-YlaC factor YlaD
VGKDRPEVVADLPAVRALIERVLELDETYEHGAAHSLMMILEALPAAMGGSEERARMHFEKAVELSSGHAARPYVTLAESVSVTRQDAFEFRALLQKALAVDLDAEPSFRLMNVVAQRRARDLLRRISDLFFDLEGLDDPREDAS